jgi:hypothetical protein
MISLGQFIATGAPCSDLGAVIREEFLEGQSGRLYLGTFYIMDHEGGYRLEVEGDEWNAPAESLNILETALYEWARESGFFEGEHAHTAPTCADYRRDATEAARRLEWQSAADLWDKAIISYPGDGGQLGGLDRARMAERRDACLGMVGK